MRNQILMLVALLTGVALSGAAQQPKVTSPKSELAASAQITPRTEKPVTIDADEVYKANCSRCHLAPRKFSERKMATIMLHMRRHAYLTRDEADAVLQYLTR